MNKKVDKIQNKNSEVMTMCCFQI